MPIDQKAVERKKLISNTYLGRYSIHGIGVGAPDGKTIRIYHSGSIAKKIRDEIVEDSAPFNVIFEQDDQAAVSVD